LEKDFERFAGMKS